jgi:hypothetical protein
MDSHTEVGQRRKLQIYWPHQYLLIIFFRGLNMGYNETIFSIRRVSMNEKIKKFYQDHEEQIQIVALLGAQAVGVCLLCAIVAKASRAETLNNLHIKDILNKDGKLVGLIIDGITYMHH